MALEAVRVVFSCRGGQVWMGHCGLPMQPSLGTLTLLDDS